MRNSKNKKKTKREKVRCWLIRHQKLLSITAIENKLDFPKGAIHKWISYDRNLSASRVNKIDKLIKEMIFSYEE